MAGIRTPVSPTREQLVEMLRANQLGELVGLRALIDGVPDTPTFRGWLVAGTVGYLELDANHKGQVAGVWRPEETYGL